MRVLALRQSGEAISNVRALLYRTARNLVIDRHRRAVLRDHEDIDALADAAHAMAPAHAQPEGGLRLGAACAGDPGGDRGPAASCREAFVLNRFEGLSHQEVAERMGISKNMVAQHVIRGVLACQACEDAFGTGTSDHNR